MKTGASEGGLSRLEKLPVVQAIRKGLVMTIPVLMVGAAVLVLQNFPLPAYMQWIRELWGGQVFTLLTGIYNATFGLLSVLVTINISLAYVQEKHQSTDAFSIFGAPVARMWP